MHELSVMSLDEAREQLEVGSKVDRLREASRQALQYGDTLSAEQHLIEARDLDCARPEVYLELAELALTRRQYPVAAALIRSALELQPANMKAWARLGNACWRMQRYSDARVALRNAEKLAPGDKLIEQNLGLLAYFTRLPHAALDHLEKALAIDPTDKWVRNDHAHAVLMSGELKRGLELFESRWQVLAKSPVWQCDLPLWTGDLQEHNTLLIHAEQGLGDTLQFIRFVPSIKAKFGFESAIFAGPRPLQRLLSGQCGVDEYVDWERLEELLPAIRASHCHCPLISAVSHLGLEYETLPPGDAYLSCPAASLRSLYAGGAKLAVGLVWAASVGHERSRQRSVPLASLLPLGTISGVKLWSLQMAPFAREAVDTGADLLVSDATIPVMDFADTAAIVQSMDAVVSVDTSMVHLAGALGKPTFMLNPVNQCWRWCRGSEVWYKSVSLYDQDSSDLSWTFAIDRIKTKIAGMVAQKRL